MRTVLIILGVIGLVAIGLTACQSETPVHTERPAEAPAEERAEAPVLLAVFHPDGERQYGLGDGSYARFGLSGPATGYSYKDLTALDQKVIETDYPLGAEPALWQGPSLSDVLIDRGDNRARERVRLTASDGYQVEISAQMMAQHDPVLAITKNGEALALGELGPAILIWPRGTDPELSNMNDDLWIFSVFAIEELPAREN